jgi:hypothetical protein
MVPTTDHLLNLIPAGNKAKIASQISTPRHKFRRRILRRSFHKNDKYPFHHMCKSQCRNIRNEKIW